MKVLVTEAEPESDEIAVPESCEGCIADDGCFDLCDPIQNSMQVDCESERVIFKIVDG